MSDIQQKFLPILEELHQEVNLINSLDLLYDSFIRDPVASEYHHSTRIEVYQIYTKIKRLFSD